MNPILILFIVLLAILLLPFLPTSIRSIKSLIVILPIIHAVADSTTNFFPASTLNPGSIRVIIVLAVIFAAGGLVLLNNGTTWLIYAFMVYLLGLVFISSNSLISLENFIKVFVTFMMFPLGYVFIRDTSTFSKLNTALLIASFLVVLQLMIAQLFELGRSAYIADTFYQGGAGIGVSYNLVFLVVISPLLLATSKSSQKKLLIFVLAGICFLLVFVILRRMAILSLIVSLIVYFLLTKKRIRIFKIATATLLISLIIYPVFADSINQRMGRRMENVLEEEARIIATQAVVRQFFTDSPKHSLIGTDVFASSDYYDFEKAYRYQYIVYDYSLDNRPLHADFNVLLHGAGIVGILFYGLVYVAIIWQFLRYRKFLPATGLPRETEAVFWAIIVGSLIISMSNSFFHVFYRGVLFLYLGAIIGILETVAVRVRNEQSVLRNSAGP